jgi:hypothetical protein
MAKNPVLSWNMNVQYNIHKTPQYEHTLSELKRFLTVGLCHFTFTDYSPNEMFHFPPQITIVTSTYHCRSPRSVSLGHAMQNVASGKVYLGMPGSSTRTSVLHTYITASGIRPKRQENLDHTMNTIV